MNVVVIGAQWGDEGKGKIVDFLASESKSVVRYSGGANAGHTIVSEGVQYALHLVPSGILHPGKTVYLGAGMVIDPEALFKELGELKSKGIEWEGRVFISDRAHLVLPRYREMDKKRDAARKRPIGTTGRGIGTTYALKSERDGIRIADLTWKEKMDDLEDEDRAFLAPYLDRLVSMRVNLTSELNKLKGERVLFEGAQGALLDLDLGTYPYVSSGFSSAAGAAIGGCIGPRAIGKILGVFKAYSTRVGNGPMPTEFSMDSNSELYHFVRETGREYGVTTGRPRRCGYLDLVALRYACQSNSIDDLVLTHLDVYDSLDDIEACVAYDINGTITEEFPASIDELTAAKPVLRHFKGWKTCLKDCRSYSALPKEAKDYVDFIEQYTQTRIGIISVGYDRNDTFIRDSIWN
ncbi:MAG TPA: adenylosuccinate synthase [Treponemataceae bacterium]|nr:MAG: Adenylosuccinate synthetase [Spirochaetes bacterium ADurb.Bin269]HOC28724.1 adenylosuccinate synthase [Treponemataceae bacterium]HQL32485.1 adenylosuccinate synthase [Treponemataceae bacterium]